MQAHILFTSFSDMSLLSKNAPGFQALLRLRNKLVLSLISHVMPGSLKVGAKFYFIAVTERLILPPYSLKVRKLDVEWKFTRPF